MCERLMPGIPRTIADDPDMETVRRIRASIVSDTGQVVESDLLLGCPFCGARPYVQVHELDETCVEARVVCSGCHVSTAREYQSWRVWHGDDELTRTLAMGRAISCWNRREKRTCRVVRSGEPSPTGVPRERRCSECGGMLTRFWAHCPHCGAKIVKEDA